MSAQEANPLPSQELAAFVCAMEALSVHGAADALDLTPSAVTKRLQSLERRTGVRLFERGRFGLRATDAARVLYPEAKRALADLAHAAAVLREHAGGRRGVVRLAASFTIGEYLLPGWLAEFRLQAPDARPQLDVVNSPGAIAAIRSGRAEIGFVEGLDPLDGLDQLTVHRDTIRCVVARGHRWARRRRIRLSELSSEPYISRELGSGTRAVAAAALAAAGVTLEPSLEAGSTQSIKRTLNGGGFAILSELAVALELQSGALHALELPGVSLERELKAIQRADARLDGDTRRLWQWLRDERAADASARMP